MHKIHPTAVVEATVELGEGVEIEPYAVITGDVKIGAGTRVLPHTVISGLTIIGEECELGPAAYIGLPPQHRSNAGVGSAVVIGDRTIVRETVTIHRSTRPGLEHATRIGDDCFFMAASHVGHDCRVGNDVTMANAALLGGHVLVGDRTFIGGGSAAHQYCRIGRLAIIAGLEQVTRDVIPFAAFRYGGLKGYNAIGCKRAGLSAETIHSLRVFYRSIHAHRTVAAAIETMRNTVKSCPEVQEILDFMIGTKRGMQASARFARSLGSAPLED